jgi:hypothetical protein
MQCGSHRRICSSTTTRLGPGGMGAATRGSSSTASRLGLRAATSPCFGVDP